MGVTDVEELTDNEREEQLRRWWGENWAWIVGGVALGLAGLWGYNYWQSAKASEAQQDASAYQSVIALLGEGKLDEAAAGTKALRDLHPKSPYADQADLAVARAAVESRKYEDGAGHLRTVMDGSRDAELRMVARARLARVLIEQAKYDDALALLDVEKAGAYAALFHELRGDAYAGKQSAAEARREYDAALAVAEEASGLDREFVELKRDALPEAATAATAAPAATPAAPPAEAPAAGGATAQ
jgi:predicted negative regulator of RcsB-dependent stress response